MQMWQLLSGLIEGLIDYPNRQKVINEIHLHLKTEIKNVCTPALL